jgi:hypothetical protein
VKLEDISGTKKEYMKTKIDELETKSKTKDLYRGINDLTKGYQSGNNIAICLEPTTAFWLGGGTISLSPRMYLLYKY